MICCPKSTPLCVLRLLTGTIPLGAHIDILKLMYFWRLTHRDKNIITFKIYNFKRKRFLESNVGYVNEIFDLCCKYDQMWVSNGTINPKKNPFAKIKREITEYHMKLDLEKAKNVKCIYTSTCLSIKVLQKVHVRTVLSKLWVFRNSKHRRFFHYSFLDTCAYFRTCHKCGKVTNDVLQHNLTDCQKSSKLRVVLRLKLILFNAHKLVDPSKLSCKKILYILAMQNRVFRDALCDFLVKVGNYTSELGRHYFYLRIDYFYLRNV